MFAVVISSLYISSSAFAQILCRNNSQFKAPADLVHKIAVIGPDDRHNRTPGEIAKDLESAQGRLWCFDNPPPDSLTKEKMKKLRRGVSNATLAFENNRAIVCRHLFVCADKTKKTFKPENCLFEHVSSGELIPLVSATYSKLKNDNDIDDANSDFALVTLKHTISEDKATALKKEDFFIDTSSSENITDPIKIASNYAANNKDGNPEALTLTTCKSEGRYNLLSGELANVYGTICDTGEGSSCAQAYREHDGRPKMFGVVTGEMKKKPEGGTFDPEKLSTLVTRFDESIFSLYEKSK